MNRITILLVDDHEMVREGLRSLLRTEDDLVIVGEAADGEAAIDLHRKLRPDITLMDVRLPLKSGILATRQIVSEFPQARIIVVTTFEGDGHIHAALEAGAWAYLIKDAMRKEVISAIRTVHGGRKFIAPVAASTLIASLPRVQLTPREQQVLQLMVKGLRNREIGDVIGTTEGTVKAQVRAILTKLDVSDRTEAVATALQRGLIDV